MKTIQVLVLTTSLIILCAHLQAAPALRLSIDTTPTLVLPVRWLDFNAAQNSQGVLLRWSTLHEQGIREFVIQRSTDNLNFLPIGSVIASGNSTSFEEYSYLDRSSAAGNNYYRVMSTDENGFQTISIIRKVNNVSQHPALPVVIDRIYAVGKTIQLHAIFHHHQSAEISVYSRAGRRMMKKIIHSDSNSLSVDMLKSGLYYVSTGFQTFGILLGN